MPLPARGPERLRVHPDDGVRLRAGEQLVAVEEHVHGAVVSHVLENGEAREGG